MKGSQRHRHWSQLAFIEHLLCARACGKRLAHIITCKLAYSNPIIILIWGINESQRSYLTSKFTQLTCGPARIKTQITCVSNSSSPASCVLRLERGLGRREGYMIPPPQQDPTMMGSRTSANTAFQQRLHL